MLTLAHLREIMADVSFPGFEWHLRGDFVDGGQVTLHATFAARDNDPPHEVALQTTRKWLLSKHMVTGEVVQTALKCVLTAIEHEATERFSYRGERIYGPHFSVDELVRFCIEKRTEVRA